MIVLFLQSPRLKFGILKGTYFKAIKQRHQGHLALKNTWKLETILGH